MGVIGDCRACEGHTGGVTCGRHCCHVVFLRGGQYRNDRRDVSHRGYSASSRELWRQRDHHDDGLIGAVIERQATSADTVLLGDAWTGADLL